jgi:hypothetical protein
MHNDIPDPVRGAFLTQIPQITGPRSSLGGQRLAHTAIPRNVPHTRSLSRLDIVLGQDTLDLNSIDARHVALQPLEARDPALARVGHGHQAVEDLGCAVLDRIGVAGKLEEGVAVRAALLDELLVGLHKGTHHAGAHVAVLVGRNVVGLRHSGGGYGVVRRGCWMARGEGKTGGSLAGAVKRKLEVGAFAEAWVQA